MQIKTGLKTKALGKLWVLDATLWNMLFINARVCVSESCDQLKTPDKTSKLNFLCLDGKNRTDLSLPHHTNEHTLEYLVADSSLTGYSFRKLQIQPCLVCGYRQMQACRTQQICCKVEQGMP